LPPAQAWSRYWRHCEPAGLSWSIAMGTRHRRRRPAMARCGLRAGQLSIMPSRGGADARWPPIPYNPL
jgi:hypothetical protein